MSTEELEKYKALYSQFLEEVVNLHNAHYSFLKYSGRETKLKVRKIVKNIIKLQKDMYKGCSLAYNERRENSKEYFANKREDRAYRKANPLPKGRKKKNDNNKSNANNV